MKQYMKSRKPIRATAAARLAKTMARMCRETDIIAFNLHAGQPEIHISQNAMERIAPMDQWTLNQPRNLENAYYPWMHSTTVLKVLWYCITEETITAEPVTETAPAGNG